MKSLDAGKWFADEPIPTLQETLDLIGGKVRLNVYVKAYADTLKSVREMV